MRSTSFPTAPDRGVARRTVLGVFGAGVLGAVLAACGDDRSAAVLDVAVEPPATTEPDPATWTGPRADVESIDNTFAPKHVEVAPGTLVVWRNGGHAEHDVYAADRSWGVAPEDFPPGSEFSHLFTEPGDHTYYCTIHGTTEIGMVGVVTVV